MADFLRPFQRAVHALTPNAGNRRWLAPNRGIGGGVNFPSPPPDVPTFVTFDGTASRLQITAAPVLNVTTQLRGVLKLKFTAAVPASSGRMFAALAGVPPTAGGTTTQQVVIMSVSTAGVLSLRIGTVAANSYLTYLSTGGTGNPGGASDLIDIMYSVNSNVTEVASDGFSVYVNGVFTEYVYFSSAVTIPIPANTVSSVAIGASSTDASQTAPAPFWYAGQMSEIRLWLQDNAEPVGIAGNYPLVTAPYQLLITIDVGPGDTVLPVSSTAGISNGMWLWTIATLATPVPLRNRVVSFVPNTSITLETPISGSVSAAIGGYTISAAPPGHDTVQALGLPVPNGSLSGVQPQIFYGGSQTAAGWNSVNLGTWPNLTATGPVT
jgi:hypothetical protein